MASHCEQAPVLTATLATGVALVERGIANCSRLIDRVLVLDHSTSETILWIGDAAFYQTADGPYPNSQMRVSALPHSGYAALSHADNRNPVLAIANSYNPKTPSPDIHLVFNGETGAVFPRNAAIPIVDARRALNEWLRTRQRPECIKWIPYDEY